MTFKMSFFVNWTESPIVALLENSLKHVLYSTFHGTISHSDLLFCWSKIYHHKRCYVLEDIHFLLTFCIWPKRYCITVCCSLHNLHWLFSVSPLTSSKFSGFSDLFYHWQNGWCFANWMCSWLECVIEYVVVFFWSWWY